MSMVCLRWRGTGCPIVFEYRQILIKIASAINFIELINWIFDKRFMIIIQFEMTIWLKTWFETNRNQIELNYFSKFKAIFDASRKLSNYGELRLMPILFSTRNIAKSKILEKCQMKRIHRTKQRHAVQQTVKLLQILLVRGFLLNFWQCSIFTCSKVAIGTQYWSYMRERGVKLINSRLKVGWSPLVPISRWAFLVSS